MYSPSARSTSSSSGSSWSSSDTSFGSLDHSKDANHLLLFQSLSGSLRSDPNHVIERLTRWFVSAEVSPLWTPFALSIRGLAFEELDDEESARDDYIEAISLYRYLQEQLGKKCLTRFDANIQFMNARLKVLPPGDNLGLRKEFFIVDQRDY